MKFRNMKCKIILHSLESVTRYLPVFRYSKPFSSNSVKFHFDIIFHSACYPYFKRWLKPVSALWRRIRHNHLALHAVTGQGARPRGPLCYLSQCALLEWGIALQWPSFFSSQNSFTFFQRCAQQWNTKKWTCGQYK